VENIFNGEINMTGEEIRVVYKNFISFCDRTGIGRPPLLWRFRVIIHMIFVFIFMDVLEFKDESPK
jgi:hypothetical protein